MNDESLYEQTSEGAVLKKDIKVILPTHTPGSITNQALEYDLLLTDPKDLWAAVRTCVEEHPTYVPSEPVFDRLMWHYHHALNTKNGEVISEIGVHCGYIILKTLRDGDGLYLPEATAPVRNWPSFIRELISLHDCDSAIGHYLVKALKETVIRNGSQSLYDIWVDGIINGNRTRR